MNELNVPLRDTIRQLRIQKQVDQLLAQAFDMAGRKSEKHIGSAGFGDMMMAICAELLGQIAVLLEEQREQTNSTAQKWEHLRVTTETDTSKRDWAYYISVGGKRRPISELDAVIGECGELGWELVSSHYAGNSEVYCFKRPKA